LPRFADRFENVEREGLLHKYYFQAQTEDVYQTKIVKLELALLHVVELLYALLGFVENKGVFAYFFYWYSRERVYADDDPIARNKCSFLVFVQYKPEILKLPV